jgi:hypothetical protein
MDKVDDYKQHADDCRRMARSAATPEHKSALLRMAETWDNLADARAVELERAKRIAELNKVTESAVRRKVRRS